MSSERTLPLLVSVLVIGASVACSDSEPGDDDASSGAGGTGGSVGKGGNAGNAGSAGGSGTDGNGEAGIGGEGGMPGAGGSAAGSAGESGAPGAGGDDGSSGSGGSSGAPAASDVRCGVRPGGDLAGEHVLRFETAAGDVVQLQRAYESAGVGESSIYRLDGMGVRFNGEEICIGASDTLEYINTHHNWFDEAHGTKDGLRYQLALQFSGQSTFAVFDENDAAVLEPVPVVWTGFPQFCYTCMQAQAVAITEVLANNTSFHADEDSEYEPLIEIFNAGSDDIDLTGWTLSNSFSERDRWTFESGTMLLRHETILVFADGETAEGPLHANFELNAAGGQVILTAPDGSTDGGVEYPAQAPDQSLAYTWTDGYVTSDAPALGEPPPEI
jgi:hypothetical protein